jgi:hypothetical protein
MPLPSAGKYAISCSFVHTSAQTAEAQSVTARAHTHAHSQPRGQGIGTFLRITFRSPTIPLRQAMGHQHIQSTWVTVMMTGVRVT